MNPRRGSSVVEQWTENPRVGGSTPPLGTCKSCKSRIIVRKWLSGRASPCQGEGRGFESRLPLHFHVLSLYQNAALGKAADLHTPWRQKCQSFV